MTAAITSRPPNELDSARRWKAAGQAADETSSHHVFQLYHKRKSADTKRR
jgi:hypothetical protein